MYGLFQFSAAISDRCNVARAVVLRELLKISILSGHF
jgi:hypothetical protein